MDTSLIGIVSVTILVVGSFLVDKIILMNRIKNRRINNVQEITEAQARRSDGSFSGLPEAQEIPTAYAYGGGKTKRKNSRRNKSRKLH